jgi:AcrR family transcriptional regulator
VSRDELILSRALLSLLISSPLYDRLGRMNASLTARERARAELTREIKEEARRQVAAEGAQRLSLRAVARELGMVSSAVYRYFPSRDSLLTALIIDAYDALGAAVELADTGQPRSDLRGRWRAICHSVRDWAVARPHEYALIYGSPVPGYRAPQETIAPASRAGLMLGHLLTDAWASRAIRGAYGAAAGSGYGGGSASSGGIGSLGSDSGSSASGSDCDGAADAPMPPMLAEQAAALAAAIAPAVPGPVILRGVIAWTQLFGMISFELFGQFVGVAEPADDFFRYAVEQMANFAGLP